MQRDFVEPGGFGAALGNDVQLLAPIIPAGAGFWPPFASRRLTVIHTKECHQPDLADCPPAKLTRGRGKLTIGDPGPMGRILIDGEPGNDFVASSASRCRAKWSSPSRAKARSTPPTCEAESEEARHHPSALHRRHDRSLRADTMREANDRGYECLLVEDGTESYFPEFKKATLDMVRAQGGIVGWTATTEQVLAGLNSLTGAGIDNGPARANDRSMFRKPRLLLLTFLWFGLSSRAGRRQQSDDQRDSIPWTSATSRDR